MQVSAELVRMVEVLERFRVFNADDLEQRLFQARAHVRSKRAENSHRMEEFMWVIGNGPITPNVLVQLASSEGFKDRGGETGHSGLPVWDELIGPEAVAEYLGISRGKARALCGEEGRDLLRMEGLLDMPFHEWRRKEMVSMLELIIKG